MASPYGLLPTGFIAKPTDQILSDAEAVELTQISPALDLEVPGIAGTLNGIVSDGLGQAWEVLQVAVNGMDPTQATGDQLTSVSMISGTKRLAAKATYVSSTFLGTSGSFAGAAPNGLFASPAGNPSVLFTNVQTLLAGIQQTTVTTDSVANQPTILVPLTTFAVSGSKVWICPGGVRQELRTVLSVVPGVSITFTEDLTYTHTAADADIVVIAVDFIGVNTGPVSVPSGTLTTIAVAAAGWSGIYNILDGTTGYNVESDVDLRIRRQAELSQAGSSTAAAISGVILSQIVAGNVVNELNGGSPIPHTVRLSAASVTTLHNDTDVVDANGLSPHTIEAIVYQVGYDGTQVEDNRAIATLLSFEKGAGINTESLSSGIFNVTYSPVDSEGVPQIIHFSRPTEDPLTVTITAKYDPLKTTATALAANIKAALVDYAQSAFAPGVGVYGFHLVAQAFAPDVLTGASPVPGLLTVTSFTVNGVTDVAIGPRDVATLSAADITITPIT